MSAPQIYNLLRAAVAGAPAAAKLKKASQDIEAIFVKDLLAAMRKTAKHQSLGNELGGDMYQDLFDQAISESVSKSGTLGIASTIYREMAPIAIRAAIQKAMRGAPMFGARSEVVSASVKYDGGQDGRETRGQVARATNALP